MPVISQTAISRPKRPPDTDDTTATEARLIEKDGVAKYPAIPKAQIYNADSALRSINATHFSVEATRENYANVTKRCSSDTFSHNDSGLPRKRLTSNQAVKPSLNKPVRLEHTHTLLNSDSTNYASMVDASSAQIQCHTEKPNLPGENGCADAGLPQTGATSYENKLDYQRPSFNKSDSKPNVTSCKTNQITNGVPNKRNSTKSTDAEVAERPAISGKNKVKKAASPPRTFPEHKKYDHTARQQLKNPKKTKRPSKKRNKYAKIKRGPVSIKPHPLLPAIESVRSSMMHTDEVSPMDSTSTTASASTLPTAFHESSELLTNDTSAITDQSTGVLREYESLDYVSEISMKDSYSALSIKNSKEGIVNGFDSSHNPEISIQNPNQESKSFDKILPKMGQSDEQYMSELKVDGNRLSGPKLSDKKISDKKSEKKLSEQGLSDYENIDRNTDALPKRSSTRVHTNRISDALHSKKIAVTEKPPEGQSIINVRNALKGKMPMKKRKQISKKNLGDKKVKAKSPNRLLTLAPLSKQSKSRSSEQPKYLLPCLLNMIKGEDIEGHAFKTHHHSSKKFHSESSQKRHSSNVSKDSRLSSNGIKHGKSGKKSSKKKHPKTSKKSSSKKSPSPVTRGGANEASSSVKMREKLIHRRSTNDPHEMISDNSKNVPDIYRTELRTTLSNELNGPIFGTYLSDEDADNTPMNTETISINKKASAASIRHIKSGSPPGVNTAIIDPSILRKSKNPSMGYTYHPFDVRPTTLKAKSSELLLGHEQGNRTLSINELSARKSSKDMTVRKTQSKQKKNSAEPDLSIAISQQPMKNLEGAHIIPGKGNTEKSTAQPHIYSNFTSASNESEPLIRMLQSNFNRIPAPRTIGTLEEHMREKPSMQQSFNYPTGDILKQGSPIAVYKSVLVNCLRLMNGIDMLHRLSRSKHKVRSPIFMSLIQCISQIRCNVVDRNDHTATNLLREMTSLNPQLAVTSELDPVNFLTFLLTSLREGSHILEQEIENEITQATIKTAVCQQNSCNFISTRTYYKDMLTLKPRENRVISVVEDMIISPMKLHEENIFCTQCEKFCGHIVSSKFIWSPAYLLFSVDRGGSRKLSSVAVHREFGLAGRRYSFRSAILKHRPESVLKGEAYSTLHYSRRDFSYQEERDARRVPIGVNEANELLRLRSLVLLYEKILKH